MNWKPATAFDGREIVTLVDGARDFGHYIKLGSPVNRFAVPSIRGRRAQFHVTEAAARADLLNLALHRVFDDMEQLARLARENCSTGDNVPQAQEATA